MAFRLGIPFILDEGGKSVEGLPSQCGQHLPPPSQPTLGFCLAQAPPGHLRVEETWGEFSPLRIPCDLGQVGLSLGASVSHL